MIESRRRCPFLLLMALSLPTVAVSLPLAASAQAAVGLAAQQDTAGDATHSAAGGMALTAGGGASVLAVQSQDGIRAHQAQLRARQLRLRDTRSPTLPRFSSGVTVSDDQASIPLRLQDSPGRRTLAQSPYQRFNSYTRGDLRSDSGDTNGAGLSTTDLTVGTDYSYSPDATIGVAVGRLSTREAFGTTLSTYLTVQPVERIYLDVSLSVGRHQARADGAAADGISRGFSVALNHPRQVGHWTVAPYTRYDHLIADVDGALDGGSTTLPVSRDVNAVSIGSIAETSWSSPFGALRPTVVVELQREAIAVAGAGDAAVVQTHGTFGVGMTTRVSRDMSAFAESRYTQSATADFDRQVMLGVKLAFR
ncbi:MAG: autotransporter domain-containing protein [Lautropia sp.]